MFTKALNINNKVTGTRYRQKLVSHTSFSVPMNSRTITRNIPSVRNSVENVKVEVGRR